ncbi:MAG: 4'-phosphopantetheinyl transferase superfamily protein [Deltaproteobacteria bacterium]|nr:4'-phosphopantetheinyl transferase superfamily protein [Deltaproteobacteria bacterium]
MSTTLTSWATPPKKLILSENDVHVWIASLDDSGIPAQDFAQILSEGERRKADRFVFERDKDRFVTRRGVLRTIIGRYYLAIQPYRLKFHYGVRGKPHLAECSGDDTLRYNQADSNGLALYAFSKNRDVGIDVEFMQHLTDAQQIVDGSFSEYEKAAYNTLLEREKHEAFFNCWTRKEAFIKAIGEGLYFPLDQFDVSIAPGESARLLRVAGQPEVAFKWSLTAFTPEAGYKAALAVKSKNCNFFYWRFYNRDYVIRN